MSNASDSEIGAMIQGSAVGVCTQDLNPNVVVV